MRDIYFKSIDLNPSNLFERYSEKNECSNVHEWLEPITTNLNPHESFLSFFIPLLTCTQSHSNVPFLFPPISHVHFSSLPPFFFFIFFVFLHSVFAIIWEFSFLLFPNSFLLSLFFFFSLRFNFFERKIQNRHWWSRSLSRASIFAYSRGARALANRSTGCLLSFCNAMCYVIQVDSQYIHTRVIYQHTLIKLLD